MIVSKYVVLDLNNEEIVCCFDDPRSISAAKRIAEYLVDYPDANLGLMEESHDHKIDIEYNVPVVEIKEIPAVARRRKKP